MTVSPLDAAARAGRSDSQQRIRRVIRRGASASALSPTAAKVEVAREAATRARRLQGERIDERVIAVAPGIAALLPGGGLRPGTTYGIDGSTSLTAAMIAGPSSHGLWCAIVGMPGFAAEAAAGLGCDLDHIVFVPSPGRDWVNVVAALIDALTVVVVRPQAAVSDAEASRLGARLRQREGVLIACGPWPRADTRLSIDHTSWTGLGQGHGHLSARQVRVNVGGRGARRHPGDGAHRGTLLWLPDRAGDVRLVEDPAAYDGQTAFDGRPELGLAAG